MYEQKYIERYGENYLKDYLDGKVSYTPNINNRDEKALNRYFAFQHYLIKAYVSGYKQAECVKYLKGMYNDFHAYPHLFADSPLLMNQTLDALMGDSDLKKKVIQYRDSYFDKNEASKLYQKEKTTELSDVEKNRLYANLMHFIYSDNPTHKKVVESEIRRIMNADFKSLNEAELTFYCQYISKYAVGSRGYRTHVVFGTTTGTEYAYASGDFIFVNVNAFDSIAMMTETICHETRHTVQEHESHGKNTRSALDMAQRRLFHKYLNTSDYDSYKLNYRYSGIELDAEKHGHWDAGVILSTFGRGDLAEEVRNNRIETTDTRNYYDYMLDSNKNPLPTDMYIVHRMNQIIKDHPEEINIYPVLNKFYNKDGSLKPFSETVNQRMNVSIDERGLYDNYINVGISEGRLSEINLSGASDEYIAKFNSKLADIYRENICFNINNYFADTENSYRGRKYYNGQIISVTTYKLGLAYSVLKFVNNNFDLLAKAYSGEKITNQNALFSFIYDFRDFDPSQIKNPIILGNKGLMDKISKFKSLVDEVITKFNKLYIDSRMNEVPSNIRSMIVPSSEYGNMTFDEYMKKVVVNKMDGHQEVTINNQKVYASELLKLYVSNLQNNSVMASDEDGYGHMAM